MKNKIIDLYRAHNGFGNQMDMDFTILNEGEILYKMKVSEKHLATPISAHGGALAGLMDASLGVAGLSLTAKDGNIVSTVEFKINFLKPVKLNDELESHAKVISAGRRILYIEAEIYKYQDGNRVVVAKGNGTFNAYPAEKARYMFEA